MSKEIATPKETVKPLSTYEEKRLEQLQEIITVNFQSFIQVGNALAEIRDRELYRASHRTFKLYCKSIFDIGESRAYQLMDAASVIDLVKNSTIVESGTDQFAFLPINEAQVRPLVQLKERPAQLKEVWSYAVQTAPKGKITAGHVAKAVKSFMGHEVKSKIRNTREKVAEDKLLGSEFQAAFKELLEQIEAARNTGYKTTSRMQIIAHLDQLRATVAEDGAEIESLPLMSDDRHKLLDAGFRLFRPQQTGLTITEYKDSAWHKHSGPFGTKTEMERELKALLQAPKNVRG